MNSASYVRQNLAATASVLGARQFGAYLWSLTRNMMQILSRRSLNPADIAFMDGREFLEVQTSGGEIRLKQPDFSLVRELYGRHIYFSEPVFIPPAGSKVIDMGANVGFFSLLCAKLGAEVLAVEAQDGFIPMAHENFVINGVHDRIKLIHCMVGASTGVFASEDRRKAASHWGEEPPTLSMDSLLKNFLSDRGEMVHLLKMDIEGSEFGLFEKNPAWLNHILHITMEVHPEFGDVSSLCEQIKRAGFRCKLVPSWHEKGIPRLYPGFLYASKTD